MHTKLFGSAEDWKESSTKYVYSYLQICRGRGFHLNPSVEIVILGQGESQYCSVPNILEHNSLVRQCALKNK